MNFYFDVWPADDIAGTALGELTQAFDRQIRAVDQAIGTGQFTINRHDSQFTDGWCAQDNLVRVRLEAGGPFAYDDPRYVFAFFIEEGKDEAVSDDEEGGETATRGGRDAVSILRRAVIYPTAQHPDDTRKWAQVPKTGNVVLTNLGPGEAMRVFLRNAVLRSPNPLAPSSHDFNVNTDSVGTDWEDSDTDWSFPVGKDYLTLLSDFVSGGVFFRMGPDLVLHCYENHPGVDLSGSITFSKGVDVRQAAEKQIHASPAMSRAIVKGSRKNNSLQFQEVVDAGIESAIGRREGSVEYKSVSTTARLIRAGRTAIAKARRQYDGPTTAGILELAGKVPFIDFTTGDSVTVDIPGVYDNDVVRVASIVLEELENGEYDPTVEFEASPFDPSTVDGFTETGNTSGGKNPNCGDCPEPEPYNPETDSSSAHAVLYFGSEGGTYPPEINWAGTGDTPPSGFPAAPKAGPISYATGGVTGYPYTAFSITDTINGATLEVLLSCAGAYAAATVTHTWTIRKNGSAIGTASQSRTFGEFPAYWSPSQLLTITGVTLSAGDVLTVELATSGWSGSPPVVPGGIATSEYFRINGTAVVADPDHLPNAGQWVTEQPASDGTTALLKTNFPYTPYGIEVHVSGVREEVIQTNPATGEWTLPIVPPAGTQIIVRYQVGSTTATGATNSYLPSTAPSVVTRVLLGTGSDGSGDNVLHDDGTWKPTGGSTGGDCCGDDVAPQDRALNSDAKRLSGSLLTFVQSKTAFEQLSATISVTLDAAPSAGNLLVAWHSVRSGTAHTPLTPTGWTAHPSGTVDAGSHRGAMYYKVSDGSETTMAFALSAGDRHAVTVAEFSGTLSLDASAENTGSGTSLTTGSVTPTSGQNVAIIGGALIDRGSMPSVTPDAGWTELADATVDNNAEGGFSPVHWMAYKIVSGTSGSYNPSGTIAGSADFGGQTIAFLASTSTWTVDSPDAVDGDDSTYDADITGTEVMRLDLGASYGIVRSRVRIACATSGSRTYTIKGANAPDFSDEVTLDTVTFTATGSNTPQDIEFLWVFAGEFRYFQLDGNSESRRIHTWEVFEAAASDIIVTDPTTTQAADLQDALDNIYASVGTTVPAATDPGDILAWDGDSWEVLPVGTDGQIIYADSAQTLGLVWDAPTGGGGAADDPIADIFGTPDEAYEFGSSSLTGWTTRGSGTVDAHTTVPGHLYVLRTATGSVALTGIDRAVGTAPQTFICKLTDHTVAAVNYERIGGLYVAEATPGVVEAIHIVHDSDWSATHVRYSNLTTFNAVIGTDIPTKFAVLPLYYGIVWNSNTDIDFWWSFGGRVWRKRTDARNPSITVGRFGVTVDPESAGNGVAGAFDFVRVWNSAKTFPGL